jgi:hypothetical protein
MSESPMDEMIQPTKEQVLRAALERAEQELSYCHAAMGTNRYFARDDALKQIRRALGFVPIE